MFLWKQTANPIRRMLAGLLGATVVAAALLANTASLPAASPAEEDERLEQFLARLGLVDLQILHLEQTLKSSAPRETKQASARRLADLYAERLMTSSEDKALFDETLQRIATLTRDFPEANTTALQVMLLQADYNRAESLIAAWINDPLDSASRQEATGILERITPLLVQHDATLSKQVEQLLAKVDDTRDDDVSRREEMELKRLQGVAGRAAYFAAWANYYLGLVTQSAPQAESYQQARKIFRRILGLDAAIPADMESDWLGLESIWRARTLIGLGLSEAACGDIDASERCFELIARAAVPPEIKDQAPYWHLRALLNGAAPDRVEEFARRHVADFRPPATQGQVSFCVALVREGFGSGSAPPPPARRTLGQLGLNGLARLGQLSAVTTLIEKYHISAADDAGFVLLWATGQRQFGEAEKSKSAADYQAAAQTLQAALNTPESNALAGPASRCRYTLAWCLYRLDEFEPAAREFTSAVTGLEAAKDSLAVEAAWMAFVAYRRLSESQPRFVTAASEALKRIQHSFPDHPYAKRADYELARLLEQSDPDEMARRLEEIAPTQPNYLLARYDLCLLRYRVWSQHRQNGQAGLAQLAKLRDAADTYLKAATSDSDAQRCLKCCVMVADAALHNADPRPEIAAEILDRANRWAARLPAENQDVIEFHYRQLELATARGDDRNRVRQARWLADHAAGSPYELAGLLTVANALDGELQRTPAESTTEKTQQAYDVYQRIIALLADSSATLADSRNAQVAHSRLAHYAEQLGKHDEAAGLLEKLLDLDPRDRRLLRRAALAQLEAGKPALALPHWRTLLQGLPQGSNEWLEAKYYQLRCLAQTDREQARKVYHQFQLLHPDLGGERWRGRFTELTQQW